MCRPGAWAVIVAIVAKSLKRLGHCFSFVEDTEKTVAHAEGFSNLTPQTG